MSNIRIISTKELIPRIYDEFKIDHSDWEMKAPEYFMSAMSDMKMACIAEDSMALDFTNHRVQLPVDIKIIDAIEYNGDILYINNNIRNSTLGQNGCAITGTTASCSGHTFTEGSATLTTPCYVATDNPITTTNNLNEYHINNNWITFEAEEGCVTLYYRKPQLEFDCELNVYFPMIQDIEAIKQALMSYVVMILLRRGYKHPTLNLTDNNPFTNVGMMWKENRKSAKSKYNPISKDDMHELHRIYTTLLSNPRDKIDILHTN